jgi:translation initiation factor 3 subunit I
LCRYSLECMKTYSADRPVNAAILSPIRDHIVLGGGQDAMVGGYTSLMHMTQPLKAVDP